MIRYFGHIRESWSGGPLEPWLDTLPALLEAGLDPRRYGDLPQWQQVLEALPRVTCRELELKERVAIGTHDDTDPATRERIEELLRALIPWRKGPFWVHGIHMDTEWRSDWKWERLRPHIQDLSDRLVLDVGCGNGYHCWRMLGDGAARVVGADPSPRFVVQFNVIKALAGDHPVDVLPAPLEKLEPLPVFDSVFSMGVLYHRHSPMDHLRQLKAMLKPGGQLVLETLVIEGDAHSALVPEGRYAMMNNVWFLPSPAMLQVWLRKLGFSEPRVVDVTRTTTREQRATDWMTFHSLANFLDPDDPGKTAEGYPAPTRAIIVAERDK